MNCEACGHLWSKHGPDGCTAKVYPAHSLEGEPCPCEHTRPRGRIAWRNLYAQAAVNATMDAYLGGAS